MELQLKAAVCLLLLELAVFVVGVRIRDKIYLPISGASCFRRLNGTHQTGCSSTQSGSVGILHLIQLEEDFDFLLHNPPAPPYAPMIPPHLFTRKNIMRLKNDAHQNISVILLLNHKNKMSQFSHELNCPNQYSGIMNFDKTQTITCNSNNSNLADTWNPWGTGLLHEDFPFPIYYIEDEQDINELITCFEKFNNFNYTTHAKRRLCAVEIKTFMSGAVSSEVCMRRTNFINNLGGTKYCDPLEGRNVYATLFPRESVETIENEEQRIVNNTEKFIMVSCRLDTTSMFDGVGSGAMDSLTGYATLVNIAHMLLHLLKEKSLLLDKRMNVLFVVFNGESYDYIGSQRLVYDMENLAFPTRQTRTTPISFENIEFMLDIGTLDEISNIKLHTLNESKISNDFLTKLQKYATSEDFNFNITFENAVGTHMPPTSAQSFLRKYSSFPALVLNAPPTNKYYHSIFDDNVNVNFTYGNTTFDFTALMDVDEGLQYFASDTIQMKIRNVSSVIAMALYETLTGANYAAKRIVNPLLIDEFLYCFLQSADCPLFIAASHPNSLPGLPLPPMRYISVYSGSQEASGWTYRILGYLLSNTVSNRTKDNCTQLPLHWFAGYDNKGECRLTTQNYSIALSPAFLTDDYDWKSGEYSSWTESTWSQFSARIFLRPSKIHEIITLCIGIIVLILSFCLVYLISSRSDVLFEGAATSTDALTAPTSI